MELRKLALRGSELERYHLIEKRFTGLFGQREGDMLSVVLTKAEHQIFTKAWRKVTPHGRLGTDEASKEYDSNVAIIFYSQYPEFLKALGL